MQLCCLGLEVSFLFVSSAAAVILLSPGVWGGGANREVSGLELGNWLGSVKAKTMSGLLVFVGVKLLGLFRVGARELQHLEGDCILVAAVVLALNSPQRHSCQCPTFPPLPTGESKISAAALERNRKLTCRSRQHRCN